MIATGHLLGEVTVHGIPSGPDRWGSIVTDYAAAASCSCGAVLVGQCSSPESARQWLATEHYQHRTAGRAPCEAVALVLFDLRETPPAGGTPALFGTEQLAQFDVLAGQSTNADRAAMRELGGRS